MGQRLDHRHRNSRDIAAAGNFGEIAHVPTTTGEHVVVETNAGAVRGFWRTDSAAFLGIPFAEPPYGDLRFLAPVHAKSWSGVRDALRYGPTPQRKALAEITTIPEPSIPGEDILNLNVFTPRPHAATGSEVPLPVLVYLHGGAYVAGSPASPWYDGAAFNRDGVVTVTVSYRLGFDGFGWLPDAPPNRGILDWLLALEWVRSNISQFGGDPARVTIAGQSAGGGAVMTLLAMPRARGLFRAAASISGGPATLLSNAPSRLLCALRNGWVWRLIDRVLFAFPRGSCLRHRARDLSHWRSRPPTI
jgi:para-nitrobenzyl esterase